MNEMELIRTIRRMIRQEISPVVVGQVTSNDSASRSSVQRYSNETPHPNLRSVQPYGLASKAPVGTQAFLIPGGFDPSNQNMVGHFDETRPNLNDGEACLYNAYGQAITVGQNKITIGATSNAENMVLGQQLKTLLTQLLDFIAMHTHPGIGVPPSNASSFTNLKTNIESILSQISFTG